jgi:cytochrome c biogenesis protein ResB
MKNISIVAGLLLTSALVFMGCKNPASGEVSFDDCTETITKSEIELSDGNWAVKAEGENNNGQTRTYDLVASVTGGVVTFTSGTATTSFDLANSMTADQISAFNQLTQEQKEQMISQMQGSLPEGSSIRIDGTKVSISVTMDESGLTNMKSQFNFSALPADTEIKTNANKTKYTFSLDMGYGSTGKYYIYKL